MGEKRPGFTSFTNISIRNPNLADHLFRFMMILESHMGVKGKAKVKLSTIAKEMGKERKSAERSLKWFLQNSNLKVKKVGYLYEFYTDPVSSVLYGKTRVSHIVPHEYPIIKRSNEKEVYKNTKVDIVIKQIIGEEESKTPSITQEEYELVEKIAKWLCNPAFNPLLSLRQQIYVVRALLLKHGYKELQHIYKSIAIYGGNPHPSLFWESLKYIDNSVQNKEKSV